MILTRCETNLFGLEAKTACEVFAKFPLAESVELQVLDSKTLFAN